MTQHNRPRAAAVKISELAWRYLCDEPQPDDMSAAESAAWWSLESNNAVFSPDGRSTEKLWCDHRGDVLAWWAERHPGTRPSCWWRFDAPGPRRRIGGIGTPCHERLAHLPDYEFGLPIAGIIADMVRAYERMGLPLNVPAVDPRDAPTYESEATFLVRHKLLLAGERRRLSDEDFAAERIHIDEDC